MRALLVSPVITGIRKRLTSDAHLAAVAVEHRAKLLSGDADFARFPGVRWSNPLA